MKIGSKIKYYRNKNNLSQKELGELVGLTADRIQKYENGARNPKEEQLERFSDFLDCNIEDLKSYNVSNYRELRACLLECIIVGGKDFCLGFVSSIDSEKVSDMRKYFIRETKEVLLNVMAEEYGNTMRK